MVLMPLGALVSNIYGYQYGKKEKTKTYLGTYFGYLWLAFTIALIITLAFMKVHGLKALISF